MVSNSFPKFQAMYPARLLLLSLSKKPRVPMMNNVYLKKKGGEASVFEPKYLCRCSFQTKGVRRAHTD